MSLSDEASSSYDMKVIDYILSKTGEEFYAILEKRLPPGFMEFLQITDKQFVKENIGTIIGLNSFPTEEGGFQSWQRYLAASRIVYNQSSTKEKYRMEVLARETEQDYVDMDRRQDNETEPSMEVDGSDNLLNESNIIEMRQSEYGIYEDNELEEMVKKLASGKTICPRKRENEEGCLQEFESLAEFVEHLDVHHPVCSLFACSECEIAFPSKEILRQHECTERINKTMSFCRYIIVCTSCGKHFSLDICDKSEKTMNSMRHFMIGHNSYNIILIKLFSTTKILDGSSFKISFLPTYIKQMDSYCKTCDVKILNLSDMRAHSHSFDKICCDTKWTTQLDYIKHITDKHLPNTALLVNYLSTSDFRSVTDSGTVSSAYINPIKQSKRLPIVTGEMRELLKLQRSDGQKVNRDLLRLKVYGSNADGVDFHKYMKKGYIMKRVEATYDRHSREDVTKTFMEDIYIKIQPIEDETPNMNYKRRTIMCSQCTYTTDNDSIMNTHLAECRQDIPQEERNSSNEDCVHILLDENSEPNSVYRCPIDQCDTETCSMGGLQIHLLQRHGKYAESNITNEIPPEALNDCEDFTKRINLACYLTAEGCIPTTGRNINEIAEKAFDTDVFEFIKQVPTNSEATTSRIETEIPKEMPPTRKSSDTRPPNAKRRRVTIDEELEDGEVKSSDNEGSIINRASSNSEASVVNGAPKPPVINRAQVPSTINGAPKPPVINGTPKSNVSLVINKAPNAEVSFKNGLHPISEDSVMREAVTNTEATVIARATLEQLAQKAGVEKTVETSEEPQVDIPMEEGEKTTSNEIGSLDELKMFKKICPYCGLHFTKEKYLKKHIALHAELSLDCKVCKKAYSNLCELYTHHMTCHTKKPPKDNNVDYTDRVLCGVCNMTHFKSAIFSHHIYDCYKATHCGICSEDLTKLNRAASVKHMKDVHKNDYERFTCGCKKTFFHFLCYKNHECERNAAGGRCVFCKAAFKSVKYAATHVMEVHSKYVRMPSNRMQCQECTRTVDKSAMITHSSSHVTPLGREQRLDSIKMEQNMMMKLNIEKHECPELEELVKVSGDQSNERVIQQGFVNNTVASLSEPAQMGGHIEQRRMSEGRETSTRVEKSKKEANTTQKKTSLKESSPAGTIIRKMPVYEDEPEENTTHKEVRPDVTRMKEVEIDGASYDAMDQSVYNATSTSCQNVDISHNTHKLTKTYQEPMEQEIAHEDNADNQHDINVVRPVVYMETIFGEDSDSSAKDIRPPQNNIQQSPALTTQPTAENNPEDNTPPELAQVTHDVNPQEENSLAAPVLEPMTDVQTPPSVQIIEPECTTETSEKAGEELPKKEELDYHEDITVESGRQTPLKECISDEEEEVAVILVKNTIELSKPLPLSLSKPIQPAFTFKPTADDDDDIQVADETTQSTRLKCDSCSVTFAFQRDLEKHIKIGHAFDSKEKLCEEWYGLPKTGIFYLCRLEPIAFEDLETFKKHQANHIAHKKNLECLLCTGVALQTSAEEGHMANHNKGMAFRCTKCDPHVEFTEEHFLFEHVRIAHNTDMVYFCKVCGLASLDCTALMVHTIQRNCGLPKNINVVDVKYIGMHPAMVVRYSPRSNEEHEEKLKQNPHHYMDVPVCAHHTFVRDCEFFTTCPERKECFGLANLFRFKNFVEANHEGNQGKDIENIQKFIPSIRDNTPADPYKTMKYVQEEFIKQFSPSVKTAANVAGEVPYSSCAVKAALSRPYDPRARLQQQDTGNHYTQQSPMPNAARPAVAVHQTNHPPPPPLQNMVRPAGTVNQTNQQQQQQQHPTQNMMRSLGAVNQMNQQPQPMQNISRPTGMVNQPNQQQNIARHHGNIHPLNQQQNIARPTGLFNSPQQQASTSNAAMHSSQLNQLMGHPHINNPTQTEMLLNQANQMIAGPQMNNQHIRQMANVIQQLTPMQRMGLEQTSRQVTPVMMVNGQQNGPYLQQMAVNNQARQNYLEQNRQIPTSCSQQFVTNNRSNPQTPTNMQMPNPFNQQHISYNGPNPQAPTNMQTPILTNQQHIPYNGINPQTPTNMQMPGTSNQTPSQLTEGRCALCMCYCQKAVRMTIEEATRLILRTYESNPYLKPFINDVTSYCVHLVIKSPEGPYMVVCRDHFPNYALQPDQFINSSLNPKNYPTVEQLVYGIQSFKNAHAVQTAPPAAPWNAKMCYFCDIYINERNMVVLDPSNQQQMQHWHATRKHLIESAVNAASNLKKRANELPVTLNAPLHFCIRHVNPQTISYDDTGHLRYVNVPNIYCDYSKVVAGLVPDIGAMNYCQNRMIQIMVSNSAMQQAQILELRKTLKELKDTNKCKSELCNNAVLVELPADRFFHEMHLSQNLFHCVECGEKVKDEKSLVNHMVDIHMVNPNQAIKFNLCCPLAAECGVTQGFDKLMSLRTHMNKEHASKLSHHSNVCRAQFHTEQAAKQHDYEHGDDEFACCYLCGLVADLSTEQKTRHLLAHCIIKGPVACQVCCQQFTSEVELLQHFRESHVKKVNDDKEECACKASGKTITSVHIQENHKLAFGSLPDNYVVKLSPTFEYWLGLR